MALVETQGPASTYRVIVVKGIVVFTKHKALAIHNLLPPFNQGLKQMFS